MPPLGLESVCLCEYVLFQRVSCQQVLSKDCICEIAIWRALSMKTQPVMYTIEDGTYKGINPTWGVFSGIRSIPAYGALRLIGGSTIQAL